MHCSVVCPQQTILVLTAATPCLHSMCIGGEAIEQILANQPSLEVPGAALRLDISLPGFSGASLATAPRRLAAVDGEAASHGMFWKLVKIMIIC